MGAPHGNRNAAGPHKSKNRSARGAKQWSRWERAWKFIRKNRSRKKYVMVGPNKRYLD